MRRTAARAVPTTGEVVIGAADADLIGDALNVAARLEKACKPGRVLVGEETWRSTRGEFGYELLGEETVSGRTQPVAVYEVIDAANEVVEVNAPFVGRDPEMRRLRAVFDASVTDHLARLVTVVGSPGMGKTRLSREVCAQIIADTNALTFEIRCDRVGNATFAPIAQMIREVTNTGDDADPTVVRASSRALFSEGDSDGDRLADVLAGLVGAASARSVEETFWAVRRMLAAVLPRLELMRRKELVEPTGTYWAAEPVHRFHHVLSRVGNSCLGEEVFQLVRWQFFHLNAPT